LKGNLVRSRIIQREHIRRYDSGKSVVVNPGRKRRVLITRRKSLQNAPIMPRVPGFLISSRKDPINLETFKKFATLYLQSTNEKETRVLSYIMFYLNKALNYPKFTWQFEEGEVYGGFGDVHHKSSWIRKLGQFKEIAPLTIELKGVYVPYRYYPNSRRVKSYNYRRAIKDALPKGAKKLYSYARTSTKDFFVKNNSQFEADVQSIGYTDLGDFWRAANYVGYKLPQVKA